LLPPLMAIALALVFREVVVALAAGVWVGASIVAGGNPGLGLLRFMDTYALGSLADTDHASVVIFSLLLGGMIGVVARSGGAQGLADTVTRVATTPRRGQLATWGLGMAIFFDDFSNSLLVGASMRPITDKLRISREKLAFLVDATAAPVASLALISSWIGMEIGLIDDAYKAIGQDVDAYWVFIQTLPYRSYPILMIFFVLLLILSRRDFGPMLRAERRARQEGLLLREGARPAASFEGADLQPVDGKPRRWVNAALPIFVTILVVVLGMLLDGRAKILAEQAGATPSLVEMFGKANSYNALLWASIAGCITAIKLAVIQRILTLKQAMDAWLGGVKAMMLAMVVLVLAWSLGAVCKDLKTAQFIVGAVGGWLSPGLLPALVFMISALVSFSTGTSWGTMGILFPLVIPLAHHLAPGDETIMLGAISSILAGSVWGDHCSPISDTTVLSSMATSCDHVDHVRTQLPYALGVGLISVLVGDLATGMGWWNAWVGLLVGAGLLVGLVFLLGRKPDQ